MYKYTFYFSNGTAFSTVAKERRHIPSLYRNGGTFTCTTEDGAEVTINLLNVDEVQERKLEVLK